MFFPLQQGLGNPPPNPQQADAAAAGITIALLVFYVVVIVAAIVTQIFFLNSLSKCLQQVSPRNRKMEPGQVWLNLIPIFNYVWLILTILRIAESLQDEYEDRGLRGDGDYGKTMGIVYFVSMFVCGCVTPIFWIIYWVKIAGYTKVLIEGDSGQTDHDEDDVE